MNSSQHHSASQPVILDIYLYGESVIVIHEAGLAHGAAGPVHDGGGVLLVTIPSVGEAESLPGGGDGQHPTLGQRGAQLLDVYA